MALFYAVVATLLYLTALISQMVRALLTCMDAIAAALCPASCNFLLAWEGGGDKEGSQEEA